MNQLVNLILESNNLLLVHDLNEAMVDARVSLLETLWQELENEVHRQIPDLPEKMSKNEITSEKIREFLTSRRGIVYHGLFYDLGNGGGLGIEAGRTMYFGVCCSQK